MNYVVNLIEITVNCHLSRNFGIRIFIKMPQVLGARQKEYL